MKRLNVKNNETAVFAVGGMFGRIWEKYLWYPISR